MTNPAKKIADYFIVDGAFPSGGFSPGALHLEEELKVKFPGCYIKRSVGEIGVRTELKKRLRDRTVLEVLSFTRHDVTVKSYLVRYYHLRFVPADGHWVLDPLPS